MLGHDIYMERVEALCSRALISKLEYCHMGKKEWTAWATEHWKLVLTYVPTISLLTKGWLVFVFLEDAHTSVILDSL